MVIPEVENFLNGPEGKCIDVVILFGIEVNYSKKVQYVMLSDPLQHRCYPWFQAHVCIEQTALDLISLGKVVHIVADATSSRSQEDRMLAFKVSQLVCASPR